MCLTDFYFSVFAYTLSPRALCLFLITVTLVPVCRSLLDLCVDLSLFVTVILLSCHELLTSNIPFLRDSVIFIVFEPDCNGINQMCLWIRPPRFNSQFWLTP